MYFRISYNKKVNLNINNREWVKFQSKYMYTCISIMVIKNSCVAELSGAYL